MKYQTYLSPLILLLFFKVFDLNSVMASQKMNSNPYYDSVFLGEKRIKSYSGPHDPSSFFDEHLGEVTHKDEIYNEGFFYNQTIPHVLEWKKNWFDRMPKMAACSNFYLNQNIEYIRYLYRLVSISYLFESLKEYSAMQFTLGYKSGPSCGLSWKDVFGKCVPKSKNMKTFLGRSRFRYLLGFDPFAVKSMNKTERKTWLSSYRNQLEKNEIVSLFDLRIRKNCSSKKICSNLSEKQVEQEIEKSCIKDKNLIQLICSEEDDLYGISQTDLPRELLIKSHIMNVINQGGFAKTCLERYSYLHKNKEGSYPWLMDVFNYIKPKLEKEQSGSIQGRLFIPGALKEFDDKGLTSFLFVPPTPTPKPVATPSPGPKPTLIAPRPTAIPKPKVVSTPKPIKTPRPKPTPEVLPSQFELARMNLVKKGLKESPVKMDIFKDEFVFEEDYLKRVMGPLAVFQTQKALNDLKRYDKLGSKKTPVKLFFLKLLIDQKQHQGLWNIISVIGSEFYVRNDLEKKKFPVLCRLENSKKTDHKWQITIIDERNKKK